MRVVPYYVRETFSNELNCRFCTENKKTPIIALIVEVTFAFTSLEKVVCVCFVCKLPLETFATDQT